MVGYMPNTPRAEDAPAAAALTSAGGHRFSARRIAVGVALAAMLALYLITAAPTAASAVRSLANASTNWLLAGLAGTALSMVAFAALRGRTLAVGGSRVRLRQVLAVSYGAGAVHTSLPAGAVFSTSYAFRHLRTVGASASATTWSMAVTGLLSTLTLSGVAALGLVLTAGTGGSLLVPIVEIVVAVGLIGLLVRWCRHPDGPTRWAYRGLIGINRLRHRPAESGAARLSAVLADFRVIRPSARDWAVCAALALTNWALDLACLAACCAAVGVHIGFPALLITYTAGMAAGSLLPLPGGFGAVEAAMTLGLTVAGAVAAPALAAVVLYRLLSTGSVVGIGWLVVARHHLHTGPLNPEHLSAHHTHLPQSDKATP